MRLGKVRCRRNSPPKFRGATVAWADIVKFFDAWASDLHLTKAMRTAKPGAVNIIGTHVGAAEGGIGCGPSSSDCGRQRIANPTGENFPVTLDHSRSFHQDPERSLVPFEWDIDNDGTFDLSSNEINPEPPLGMPGGFDCVDEGGIPCLHRFDLRVTDDANSPVSTTDVVILDLIIPPHAPSANAGGPYLVCVGDKLTLDGSASFDIDEGTVSNGGPDDATLIKSLYQRFRPGYPHLHDARAGQMYSDRGSDWRSATVRVCNR